MRLEKEVRKALDEVIAERPEITKDELALEIERRSPTPDISTLIRKELNETARRFLASYKDKNGARSYLALKKKNTFINIDIADNLDDLNCILTELEKQRKGIGKAANKIEKRKLVLTGRMTIEEWLSDIGC